MKKTADYSGDYLYGDSYHGYADLGSIPGQGQGLKDYFFILRERFWWIILSLFVFVTGSAIITIQSTPLFLASTTIQVFRKQETGAQFEEVVDVSVRNIEDLNTQLKILDSHNVIQRVAKRLDGNLQQRFLSPFLKDDHADPPAIEGILRNDRKIVPLRLSLMVTIQYEHPDREIAAMISNLFAEEFISYNLSLRMGGSMKAVEDLKLRADQQDRKVQEIELTLNDFKMKYKSVSFDRSSDIDQQELLNLNDKFTDNKRLLDEAGTRWEMVQQLIEENGDMWNLSFINASNLVSSLLANLSNHKIDIAQLSKRYREKHPNMIEAYKAHDQTEEELQKALASEMEKVRYNYLRAKQDYDNSENRIINKKDEILSMQKLRVEYNSLMRNLDSTKEMYHYLYSRMLQAVTQATDEAQSARIVDLAYPPHSPYKPKVFMNLALGLFGGCVFGVCLAFFLAYIDDKVKTAYDIESVIGLPLLGLVPRIKDMNEFEKARLIVSQKEKHIVEAFRSIHSTVMLNEESKKAQVYLVTSTIPGEGKSFICTNLSMTFASHGHKTLIIDCDLRMPNIAKSLELNPKKGLIDYMAYDLSLEESIESSNFPNLDILSSGGKSNNPTQIFSQEKFKALMHELRMRYDKIIIDSPPMVPVSDAITLIPLTDGVLYVLKFNTVKRNAVIVNLRRMQESSVPVFGVILNNIKSSMAGYYYSQYYDKSYKNYYVQVIEDTKDAKAKKKGRKPVRSKSKIVT